MTEDFSKIQPKIIEKHIVDDETVQIGGKTSQKETQSLLSETMDKMDKHDPARGVYEKAWKGVKQFG